MTKQESINHLERVLHFQVLDETTTEAINVAIKTLQERIAHDNTHNVEEQAIEASVVEVFLKGSEYQKDQYNKLPKLTGWVARDDDGDLRFHTTKPERTENFDRYDPVMYWASEKSITLPKSALRDLEWRHEPQEAEIIIKRL